MISQITPSQAWESAKTHTSHAAQTVARAFVTCKDKMMETASAVFNFVYPKNAITDKREFWYLPTCVEMWIGEALYPSTCASQGGKYYDPAMQERIEKIVKRIAPHAQRPDYEFKYEIVVLNDHTVNAWAMSAGKMACNRGLVDAVDKMSLPDGITHDDVLAAVLGHELSHAAIGHTRKRLEKTFLIQLALFVGKVAASLFLSKRERIEREKAEENEERKERLDVKYEALQTLVTVGFDYGAKMASDLYMLAGSRAHEYEADEYGIRLAHKAGYDIRGAIELQKLFMDIHGHHHSNTFIGRSLEWISTHPNSQKRLEANEKTVNEILQRNEAV